MAMVDITAFMQQQGIRKARFGGLEPEDVRLALQALASEYEGAMAQLTDQQQETAQANAGLEKHCQALSAQNRTLTDQVMTLAASNEKFARQVRVQDAKNSELVTRNLSLTDQNAVLTLKNSDLVKENRQLQERTDTAEATLNVRGRELETERLEFQRTRKDLLAQAQAQADKIVSDAKAQARRTEAAANANAAAILQEARTQAQAQAQELVDSATSEANEIYNIHQLRVDSLKNETGGLETYRQDLLAYLHTMGDTLLSLREKMEQTAPEYHPAAHRHGGPPELKPMGAMAAKLDLSPDTIAGTVAKMEASTPKEAPAPVAPAFVSVAPADPDRAGEPDEDEADDELVEPLTRRTEDHKPAIVPGEVPGGPVGAIFSSPIVNPELDTIRGEVPLPGPRTPVMPVLPEDEDAEDEYADDEEPAENEYETGNAAATLPRGTGFGANAVPAPRPQPAPAPMGRPSLNAGEELRTAAPAAPAPARKLVPVKERRVVAVRALRSLRRSRAARGGL